MSSKATIEVFNNYLLVNLEGDALTLETAKPIVTNIIAQATTLSLDIILQRKLPVKEVMSVFDLYEIAQNLADIQFDKKVALVYPKDMTLKNLTFFETTCRNRNIDVKLFTDIEKAFKWIERN